MLYQMVMMPMTLGDI